MKTGKLTHKQNNWFVRTISAGKELDEIELEYYPLSLTESNVELVEGKEVEFEIKSVSYTEVDGYGEDLIKWAIVNEER
jgi:hypothetical protein